MSAWLPLPVGQRSLAGAAQRLVDAIVATSGSGTAARWRLNALLRARRLLLTAADPIVRYRLHNMPLALPLSHALPLFRRSYPSYSENLGSVARVVAVRYPELCVIDVGANVGDSVAILRAACDAPILCVEGDGEYCRLLRANTAPLNDVEIVEALLGASSDGNAVDLTREHGTARLAAVDGSSAGGLQTLDQLLVHHTRFAQAKLLKIDTDGWDYDILCGATTLLARAQPVLFIEYDPNLCGHAPQRGFEVFALLAERGYSRAVVFDNLGGYWLTVDLQNREQLEDLHRRALADAPPA